MRRMKRDENIIKPFLKWVGGKTQIIENVLDEFPKTFHNYHEICVGGGSVLLAILSYIQQQKITITGKVYAYDVNEPLIYVYKNIQSHHQSVYEEIQKLIKEYNTCENGKVNRSPQNIKEATSCQENYYYWIRSRYNLLTSDEKKTPLGSAYFIFLNKTCFRGVFRVGPNGFNVPFGNYKNPEIINKEHIVLVNKMIQNVEFICCDFVKSLSYVEHNDFAYIDPPYVPEKVSSFVKYTENGFDLKTHQRLFEILHEMTKIGKKVLMSNSDVELVKHTFEDKDKFTIKKIECKRYIHSKNPESKTNEVFIKNY